MENTEWKLIEGNRNFWNPEKAGEEIIGKIVEIAEGTYGKRYTISTIKEGKEEEIVMPSHKVLQGRLSVCAVGDEVKIIYKGEQPPKTRSENPTKLYEVYRKSPIKEEKVQ